MGKRRAWRKAMACFFPYRNQRLRGFEEDEGLEKTLMDQGMMLDDVDVYDGKKSSDFRLQPKVAVTTVLRVSMHCHGCATKVRKQLAKMQGVTSFDVDLDSKKVVVVGSISPIEVLIKISKVKTAELLTAPPGQPSYRMLLPWASPARAK